MLVSLGTSGDGQWVRYALAAGSGSNELMATACGEESIRLDVPDPPSRGDPDVIGTFRLLLSSENGVSEVD